MMHLISKKICLPTHSTWGLGNLLSKHPPRSNFNYIYTLAWATHCSDDSHNFSKLFFRDMLQHFLKPIMQVYLMVNCFTAKQADYWLPINRQPTSLQAAHRQASFIHNITPYLSRLVTMGKHLPNQKYRYTLSTYISSARIIHKTDNHRQVILPKEIHVKTKNL